MLSLEPTKTSDGECFGNGHSSVTARGNKINFQATKCESAVQVKM